MTKARSRLWPALLLLVAALLPSIAAHAQEQAARATTPGLTGYWNGIRDEDPVGADDLAITRLSIELTQRGGMVNTVIEAVLSHRNQQRKDPIEAHVAFALPDQAVVTGYALDIGGTMVAGTLLDQGKAKRVYEAEIRKGVDPGLAEVVGNRFTTRVFPIAPGGSRTVRLHFSAPADAADGFALPWLAAPIQGPVTVRYQATAIAGRPALALPWGQAMPVARSGIAWKGEALAPAGASFAAPLRITAAAVDGPIVSRHRSGQEFFEVSAGPARDAGAAAPSEPGRLRIYWDRSWSRGDDALDSEIALLGDYLAVRPASAIDLVSFAEDAPVVTTVATAAELQAALAGQRYLGATRLTGLDALKLADAAQCLMFTDGARSMDPGADFAPDCRLQIVASAPDADTAWLSNLAQDSGGQLILLARESRAAALAALTRPAAGVVRVRSASGHRLPFRSLATKGGGWHIVGPMRGQEGLTLWIADARGRVSTSYVERDEARVDRHDGAGALWAASEVARRADDPAQREATVELARKYQVAAASLAFLVLESPEQYVSADVAPPADGFDAEWRAEYAEMRKDKDEEAAEEREEHLEMVRANWAERKAWHARRFDANARAKKVAASEGADAADAAAAAADVAAAGADAAAEMDYA
ncbi:VIT domain-containing protein, partial [Sphingopyxis sp. HXXIV]